MDKKENARTFDDRPAKREKTPLLLGLVGPSGSGKTYSALRLATGIKKVCDGEIFVIDTEARRALHYADKFTYRHVPFGAPFSPLDYLQAINHCMAKGAGTIIIDSASHEHAGAGGVLEMHETELQRLTGGDWRKANALTFLAWAKPKAQRQRLVNSILQMEANFIFCFRAKEKLKIVKGEDPKQLGFMPIGGEEWVYEMTAKFLLLPGANGVPTWQSDQIGERAMIKRPEQFHSLFPADRPAQLDEAMGEAMALWAAGGNGNGHGESFDLAGLVRRYQSCSDAATYRILERERQLAWGSLKKLDKAELKAAADSCKARLDSEPPPPDDSLFRAGEGDEPGASEEGNA